MKKFKSCLFCGKRIRVYPSKKTDFCCQEHYFLFLELAKNHLKTKNAILGGYQREKQPLAAL